jgi:hypothetical protein
MSESPASRGHFHWKYPLDNWLNTTFCYMVRMLFYPQKQYMYVPIAPKRPPFFEGSRVRQKQPSVHWRSKTIGG